MEWKSERGWREREEEEEVGGEEEVEETYRGVQGTREGRVMANAKHLIVCDDVVSQCIR